jgi:uncharacterized protein
MLQTSILLPNNQSLLVEVAATSRERRIGLSRRAGLAPGRGMLLAFEQPGQYAITMQGMSFPLDLVWIDGNRRVVDLGINAPAGSPGYKSPCASWYVLEIGAGEIQRLGLKLGDVLRF